MQFFISRNGHILAIDFEVNLSNIDGQVSIYNNEEELQLDYPNITDNDISNNIPVLTKKVTGEDVEYFLNSLNLNNEHVSLSYDEDIEDWISVQAETFSTNSGLHF